MNQEFVIDGTDLICNLDKERLLAPLLQVLVALHESNHVFYCYFDADTRYKFDKDLDKQLYQSLIKFGLNNYFNQVSGGDADKLILKQATEINAIVISTDTFRNYYKDHTWLVDQRDDRLIRPNLIAGHLKIDKLGIKSEYEQDTIVLIKRLLNSLEKERNNLHGVIDKYKIERQFGFIKRHTGDKKLFFHKRKVVDETLDYTILETPVEFKIDVDQSGGIYYFCAIDIRQQQTEPQEVVLERLSTANKQLSHSKEFLYQQTIDLKEKYDKKIETWVRKNDDLLLENKELKDQLGLYKGNESQQQQHFKDQIAGLNKRIETLEQTIEKLTQIIQEKDALIFNLQKELEQLKAQRKAAIEALEKTKEEVNELAMTVDFQEEKIQHLDSDLQESLKLFEYKKLSQNEMATYEQLKKDYQVLLNSLQQKNSKINFLTNNLQDLQTQIGTVSPEVKQDSEIERLIARVNELENINQNLATQVEKIEESTQSPMSASITVEEPSIHLSKEALIPKKQPPKKVERVITYSELQIWWNNLEEQWKIAINQCVLSRGEITYIPDEDYLRSLFKRKKLDLVGSGILLFGLNQLSFKLTNLSGLKELTQITELNLSGHDLTSLEGIEKFEKLEFLNCTSNQVADLNIISQLTSLKTLIIQDNNLINLRKIEALQDLEYFNCLYNSKLKSIGKIKMIAALQTFSVDNYKTIIRLELEELQELNSKVEIRSI